VWLNRITCVLRPLWSLYRDVRLTGVVPSIAARGPLLVVANHSSCLDPWLVGFAIPRPIHSLVDRDWYDRSPFWKVFLRANGTVPVEPGDPQATLAAVEGLADRSAGPA